MSLAAYAILRRNRKMDMIIDRFEGTLAVVELEDGKRAEVPVAVLPPDAKEGDCLTLKIDKEKTEKRRKQIGQLMNDLFE